LDTFAPKLALWLQTDSKKNRKQRRNLRQMHADLVALGYTGSYDRVAAFARKWRQAQQEEARTCGGGTFIPLTFAPGDVFQFDWSEDWAVLGGVRTKLQVAQLKLAYSRAFILRAYPLQTHEMLFDAHLHAFRLLGGIPRRGIYDNMKTAVDRVGKGKVRDVNQRFQAMASHYLFEPEFCNPAAGWEKGQIEKTVQDSRRRIWQQAPAFQGLAELNAWLEQRCRELWHALRHPELAVSVAEVWAEEQPWLMVVPAPFDGFVEHTKRVSRPVSSTLRVTATVSRHPSPTARSVCGSTPTDWWWPPRVRSSPSTSGSSSAAIRPATPSTIGGITCRSCSANLAPYATAPPLPSSPRRSSACSPCC